MNTPQLRFSHAVRRIGVRRPGAYDTGRASPWTGRDPAPPKVSVWEWPFGAYKGQRAAMLELDDVEAGDNVLSVVASSGPGVSGRKPRGWLNEAIVNVAGNRSTSMVGEGRPVGGGPRREANR